MRSSFIIPAALAAMAAASPVPQDLDWDAIDALEPVPTPTIPIVDASAYATIVAYTASAAASTVSAQIAASGLSTADLVGTDESDDSTTSKRSIQRSIQKRGVAATSPDTDVAFFADSRYSAAALNASTPSGYTQTFQNLNASNNAFGYMGYTVLSSYDTAGCAAKCDAISGCASFNLYFERDPTVTPTTPNPNPASLTNIKCVFWGGPVDTANAVNVGQSQDGFHVVIAGSNGYQNNSIVPVSGYGEANYLGNAAINAPLDCNSDNTYMGVKIWTTGPFDASRCAAACTAASVYDTAVGIPSLANPQTCQFYNTYLLLKNGTSVGQYCAMYNQTWANSYATNVGQYRGYNHYTISNSYSYSNATNPGTCVSN
ncbi:hypothetical protein BDV97DRAFT_374662 [Delphinella strobiligena]|nr:hypothetical protein BDV97DRAFT_374662 [Delphinella strobiligena]